MCVCPVHQGPLVRNCPHCQARRGALTRHSRPGFCPVCKHWLGASRSDRVVAPSTEWESFVARKAVESVEQAPKILTKMSRSHSAANVRALRYATFQGNKSATARAILHSRKTIECWCDESQNPMLLSSHFGADFRRLFMMRDGSFLLNRMDSGFHGGNHVSGGIVAMIGPWPGCPAATGR